jgi:hypothetical protein
MAQNCSTTVLSPVLRLKHLCCLDGPLADFVCTPTLVEDNVLSDNPCKICLVFRILGFHFPVDSGGDEPSGPSFVQCATVLSERSSLDSPGPIEADAATHKVIKLEKAELGISGILSDLFTGISAEGKG